MLELDEFGLLTVQTQGNVQPVAWCTPSQALNMINSMAFYRKFPTMDSEGNKTSDILFATKDGTVYFWDIGAWWASEEVVKHPVFLGEFQI